jgi:hypothetical protein
MKRLLFCLVALGLVAALAAPAFAMQADFSGQYRFRWYNNANVTNGNDDIDDKNNFVDQRLRFKTTVAASENLRGVWYLEVGDLTWGVPGAVGKGVGSGVGGDGVNIETKQLYIQFTAPGMPVTTTLGLQGVSLHRSWFLDGGDELTAARLDIKVDPVVITPWFAWAGNTDTTSSEDDIWNTGISAGWKGENMGARLSLAGERRQKDALVANVDSDMLMILMGDFDYSGDFFNVFFTGGVNFGSQDVIVASPGVQDTDYKGYMFDLGANFNFDMFTLAAEFFYVSGDDDSTDDEFANFTYFYSCSHYWAEIMGNGRFDRITTAQGKGSTAVNGPTTALDDEPSNLWAAKIGAVFKPLDATTLTLNAWYAQRVEDVPSGPADPVTGVVPQDNKLGTEFDFYLDQKIYDGLTFSVIAAYMLADDAFTDTKSDSDDVYEVGLQMLYNF